MKTCQWIEGDPRREFSFCGEPTVDGVWCQEHLDRVYVSGDDKAKFQAFIDQGLMPGYKKTVDTSRRNAAKAARG